MTKEETAEIREAEEWFNNSEYGKGRIAGFVTHLMVDYAKHYHKAHQSQLKPQEGEWINVKDRLPKKDGNYMVGNPEYESGECFFEDGKWTPHDLNAYNQINITHWKLLPNRPTH